MTVFGLTGSIGSGKSTVAAMFARRGAAVTDADAIVHRLYAGAAVPAIAAAFPDAVRDGAVDRAALAATIGEEREALERLEAIVHPLVRDEQADFVAAAEEAGRRLVVIEIPLLFETGGETRVDAVIFVDAPEDVRRARVIERPGMTAERFDFLAGRQLADDEKRCRAHIVVDNGGDLAATEAAVDGILRAFAGVLAGR